VTTIPADAWKRLEGDLGRLAELGIHHNDISAGNIIWDGKRLRLLDFGLARIGERSADDVNRMRRIQTAATNGEEGQALFPLPNLMLFPGGRFMILSVAQPVVDLV